MKYLLVALVASGLIGGGMVLAKDRDCEGPTCCPPFCPHQGPQGPGAEKGDHYIFKPRRESSNSESHDNDTSHRKEIPAIRFNNGFK